jgi:hypothetical protein
VEKVILTGKRRKKAKIEKNWDPPQPKVYFVDYGFRRKSPKQERFIKPIDLCLKNIHVTHPKLKVTSWLPILV